MCGGWVNYNYCFVFRFISIYFHFSEQFLFVFFVFFCHKSIRQTVSKALDKDSRSFPFVVLQFQKIHRV